MAKSNAGSRNANSDLSPYLKARLRPLMQPKLWVSAGIFAMSAFVLVRMFMQPDQFLGQAGDDRGAAANVEANDNLSPEERAIAAELDDLEVLLKELDDEGTLEAAEAMVTPASNQANQTVQSPDLDFKTPEITIPDVNYGKFDSLPLVDLTPRRNNSQTAIAGQPAGFVGINSVSDNPALNLPVTAGQASDDQTAINPLQAALDRYAPQPFGTSFNNSGGNTQGSTLEQAISASESTALSNTAPAETAASTSSIAPTVSITNPTVTTPTTSTGTQATTPSNNAFTQLINPQSTTLQTPTQLQIPQIQTPQVTTPQVTTPQIPQVATPQFQTTPQFTTTPQFSSTPQFQTPTSTNSALPSQTLNQPVGTPVYQQSANGATNFGVPNNPPGQNIGGGQINTFSNP